MGAKYSIGTTYHPHPHHCPTQYLSLSSPRFFLILILILIIVLLNTYPHPNHCPTQFLSCTWFFFFCSPDLDFHNSNEDGGQIFY